MKSFLMLAAVLAVTLTLSACGKYEAWTWSDNNCSGNGGIYNASFCDGYVAGK